MYGKIEAVRKLVSMKPKIDGTNINGQTPLHLACLASQEEIVEILLQEGKADYESRNIEGDCPAHLAVKVRDYRICKANQKMYIHCCSTVFENHPKCRILVFQF